MPTPPRDADAGFTLIEIVVALVIVAVVLSVSVNMFASGRTAIRAKQIYAAAHSYQTAIDRFRADHGGRAPDGGTCPRRATRRSGGTPCDWGWNHGLITPEGKPYTTPAVPEVIMQGDASICALNRSRRVNVNRRSWGGASSSCFSGDGTGSLQPGLRGDSWFVYHRHGNRRSYWIDVWVKKSDGSGDYDLKCTLSGAVDGLPPALASSVNETC